MTIKKEALVAVSAVADFVDMSGFGQLIWPIDIITMILHVIYAGPVALACIPDMIPIVGFLPVYTAAALLYSKKIGAAESGGEPAA